MNTNELYHYGVKGMKWGVRKKQRSNKKKTSPNKKIAIGAALTAGTLASLGYLSYNGIIPVGKTHKAYKEMTTWYKDEYKKAFQAIESMRDAGFYDETAYGQVKSDTEKARKTEEKTMRKISGRRKRLKAFNAYTNAVKK